jgi:hypothetical protein
MTVDPTILNIILSVVGSVFSLLIAANVFFIGRLINKIDKAYEAATKAEEKCRGIDRIIRELTELKTDIHLFKHIIVNNLGIKMPDKKKE